MPTEEEMKRMEDLKRDFDPMNTLDPFNRNDMPIGSHTDRATDRRIESLERQVEALLRAVPEVRSLTEGLIKTLIAQSNRIDALEREHTESLSSTTNKATHGRLLDLDERIGSLNAHIKQRLSHIDSDIYDLKKLVGDDLKDWKTRSTKIMENLQDYAETIKEDLHDTKEDLQNTKDRVRSIARHTGTVL